MIARPDLGPAACLALLLAAALLAPVAVRAQDAPGAQDASPARNGTLSGTVTDTTGFVLPGVTVEARSLDGAGAVPTAQTDGTVTTVVTDAAGRFTIGALLPGTHDVTFTLSGFSTVVRNAVEVTAGATTTLDVEMAVLLEERVVVVGSRAQPRSVTESQVPIDAIPYEDVVSQGSTDVGDQLRTLVPSYNVNPQPVGDAARIIRPANLRGLAPDHTLVLVNGKRRHRGAVITWIGNGVSDGAQGPDISAIPSIALRQIEVLRDGAAAQYGSDAIAGVLNFQLKDDPSGGSLELHTGGYGAGDGGTYTVAGNVGLPLGRTGFANLSLEYGNTAPTSRSVQRDDAALLIAAGNDAVADPAQIWGSPTIDDNVKLWGNFGHLFAGGVQAYGHANYAGRRVESGFFFRNPNTRAAVFSGDRGRTLLIGDAVDARDGVLDGSAGCPAVPVSAGRPDQTALARILADPNCFAFQERFPGGFTPQFGGDVLDASLVAGLRGQLAGGILWDASASAGSSEADFFIYDTVNASLGPATPTMFDPGLYRQDELGLNVDLSYPLNDRVHLAGGAEWRDEGFTIGLGGEPSWQIGPYAPQGFSAGSNGFPGFSPIAAGAWSRANTALYGDLEVRGRDHGWSLGGALRLEDFEDFGTTTNGKLSGRLRLAGGAALRASASSGFRAPTPGQQNAFNVSTEYDHELMDLVNNGTIPSTSRVAGLRGGEPLQPERSVSTTLGGVLDAGPFSLTADYFRIRLADRLALTQLFALTAPEENPIARAKGNRFSVQTPFGANGAFLYVRINYGWASGG